MQKMSGRYNTVDMSSLLTTCIGLTRVISISILTILCTLLSPVFIFFQDVSIQEVTLHASEPKIYGYF